MAGDDVSGDAVVPRAVLDGSFALLASLQGLGSARVSELKACRA